MEAAAGVSREVLEGLVSDYERALRAVCGEKGLPPEWENRLQQISRDTPMGLLKTFKWLAIYSELHHERRQKVREVDAVTAQDAARALLRREPVVVTLASGRRVQVTGRSYAAMLELAAHHNRIRLLALDQEALAARYEGVLQAGWRGGVRAWLRSRRRARALERRYLRVASEIARHRERIYAHALTPSGAAARPEDPAPVWWTESTAEDDARILVALYEVGPVRANGMGDPPERRARGESKGEDWGWSGLLASWGVRTKVSAAEMYDRDLGQVLTEMRVSAPAPLEED